MEDLLPPTQFGFRKGLGTTDALITLVHDLQLALDTQSEARVISLDFSSAFDVVNHEALLFKLQSLGIGGVLLSIFKLFLFNCQQRGAVNGYFGSFTPV